MKKIIFLIILSCQLMIGFTQSVQQELSKKEWTIYFYSRIGQIQTKLYNLALQGEVKAYISDSLTTAYSTDALKYRGSNKSGILSQGIDDTPDEVFKPFNPSNLQGIWFLQKTNESVFDVNQQAKLSGIAIIYQPSYHGVMAMPQPIFHIRAADLKGILSDSELSFLMLLNHYSFNSNSLFVISGSNEFLSDEFLYHNLNQHSYNMADSNFMDKIINMCTLTQSYLSDYFKDNKTMRIIYDYQRPKLISQSELWAKYYTPVKTQLYMGVKDNEQVFKDTVMNEPVYLFRETTIESSNGKPMKFIYTANQEQIALKFSIAIQSLKDKKIAPAHVWFLEDYFSWKLSH